MYVLAVALSSIYDKISFWPRIGSKITNERSEVHVSGVLCWAPDNTLCFEYDTTRGCLRIYTAG